MKSNNKTQFKVVISCAGRFHAYDLARQFDKYQVLHQLITTYPRKFIKRFGITRAKITSLLYWEILNRGWGKFSKALSINKTVGQFFMSEAYDYVAPLFIEKADFYIGWSSNSERGLKKAKRLGMITILERGSAHILEQSNLLNEEYKLCSLEKSSVTHFKVIEKELREYDAADFISIPSKFVKNSFIKHGIPESKLIVNPYGVNLDSFKPKGKKDDVFRVIFVGQLSLQKGVHYLLEAFSNLNLPNSELILIGGKNKDIDPYLKLYEGKYSYLGIKNQSELANYYSNSSLFVLPSIQEGLAMVILQAMACGLPVLSTTNTGAEDFINEGEEGWIIQIRDVDAIRNRIVWAYNNQEKLIEMGNKACNRVKNGFTWDDYGDRYIKNIIRIGKK
jgi:glycosyltransferase involved in cell wall biosynthesis